MPAYHLLAPSATACGRGGVGRRDPVVVSASCPLQFLFGQLELLRRVAPNCFDRVLSLRSLFPGASLGMPHYNDYRWSFVGRRRLLLLLLFVVISCLFICCFCYPFAFAARFVCAELTKS